MAQSTYVVRGTFIESVEDDEVDTKRRSRTFTDSCVPYTCQTESTGATFDDDDASNWDSSNATNKYEELSDAEDESDSEIVEIEDEEDSDSEIVEIEDDEDLSPCSPAHVSSLEERAAALDELAARARAAATHARNVANATAAQQQIPLEGASTRRPSFPKAIKQMEASAIQQQTAVQAEVNDSTSLYFKNIPNDYSRDMFCKVLDSEGLVGLYDFVYLPIDFKTNSGFGYAFVNFELHEHADLAVRCLQGFARWTVPTRKVLEVGWSSALQGLGAHVERYRNSPVMHKHMPDEYKAIVLKSGVRVDFPGPTRRIRPARP